MSRPRVTITLGRSGQVVKRTGTSVDASADNMSSSGTKRSIRERLGSIKDNSLLYGNNINNKRQRGDRREWCTAENDVQVGHNDLRLKLMRKNSATRYWSDEEDQISTDLRHKLSRNFRSAMQNDSNHPISKQHRFNRIPPTRSADDLLHMESSRKSFSLGFDVLRHRSPQRTFTAQNSSGRIDDTFPPFRSAMTSNNTRAMSYLTKVPVNGSRFTPSVRRPTSASHETSKAILQPPPSYKGSYLVEEKLNVTNLLHSLGLGKYAIIFQAEEVDMAALKQMGDNDLKELGIPMGPRKKILLALASHTKRRPPREI